MKRFYTAISFKGYPPGTRRKRSPLASCRFIPASGSFYYDSSYFRFTGFSIATGEKFSTPIDSFYRTLNRDPIAAPPIRARPEAVRYSIFRAGSSTIIGLEFGRSLV